MAIALLVRMKIAPVDAGLQYLLFFPAVTLAAVVGGLWPGIFATFIGMCLSTFIFTRPYYSFSIEAMKVAFGGNLVFILDGIIVCSSIEAMHRYRERYATKLKESQFQEAHLTKMNEALHESEESYSSLFENMFDGFAHCKMLYDNGVPYDLIHLKVNRQFTILTGLKDVIGKKISEVIPGIREANPELFEIFGRVATTGQSEKFETHVEALGIWFSISVYSTQKDHFVAVFQDVTERKRTEQELVMMNNQLTHEVAKRTAELSALTAHIQKISEQERANIARELHDELGSTLTGISMEIGRVIGKTIDPELVNDLSGIKELLTNANQITRNAINQLYPTLLDNYGLVGAVESLAREFKKHSGIEVEVIFPKKDIIMEPTFSLAAYRIAQECLTNIAKHAGASNVRIEGKVFDGMLDLSIQDNGKGLSDENKIGSHGIFGMIERARYLGGTMEIKSIDGMGTIAHLSIPMAVAHPVAKKKVLVVDDHAIVRNAVRQLLESQTDDFSVEGEASDGKAAIQIALEREWDIMILDITLPKMNGLKVLEVIKKAKPNLPIIMLSSHPKDEYGEIAFAKGAAYYIEKGETDKLIEVMRQILMVENTQLLSRPRI
jgi:PAS domain S-box-containing protein